MALYTPDIAPWRQMFNPLMALNMGRVVMMLNSAEMGYYPDLMWLYRFIEKRDSTLRAVRARRAGAMRKLNWAVKTKDGINDKLAAAQAEFLTEIYQNIDNLGAAFQFLSLAEFRGYSHLEKHYDDKGMIKHLEPVPQWFWVRKFPSRDWLYNPRALQGTFGIPINRDDFIIREIDDPINEIAVIAFMRKNLSQKDWDAFIETYGIPPVFIELPLGVGLTDEYQSVADKVVSDGRGVIGNGAKVVTVDAGQRGVTPFQPHINYQDTQIVMAATAGLLTTLTAPTGLSGDGQSDQHEKAFMDVAKGEAMEISEVFQNSLDIPELKRKWGDDVQVLAYFELSHHEVDERPDIVQDAATLAQVGLAIDPAQISDETGYNLSRIQPQQAMGLNPPTGGFDDDLQNSLPNRKIFNALRRCLRSPGMRGRLKDLANDASALVE